MISFENIDFLQNLTYKLWANKKKEHHNRTDEILYVITRKVPNTCFHIDSVFVPIQLVA